MCGGVREMLGYNPLQPPSTTLHHATTPQPNPTTTPPNRNTPAPNNNQPHPSLYEKLLKSMSTTNNNQDTTRRKTTGKENTTKVGKTTNQPGRLSVLENIPVQSTTNVKVVAPVLARKPVLSKQQQQPPNNIRVVDTTMYNIKGCKLVQSNSEGATSPASPSNIKKTEALKNKEVFAEILSNIQPSNVVALDDTISELKNTQGWGLKRKSFDTAEKPTPPVAKTLSYKNRNMTSTSTASQSLTASTGVN